MSHVNARASDKPLSRSHDGRGRSAPSDDDNLKHLVVLGRSGCGKTSFLLGLLTSRSSGGGYIFIDGKVSRKTIDQVYLLSKLAMRNPVSASLIRPTR
jgi:hypothetical protein